MNSITKDILINYDFYDWINDSHIKAWNINLYNDCSYNRFIDNGIPHLKFNLVSGYYELIYEYAYIPSGVHEFIFNLKSKPESSITVSIRSVWDSKYYRLDTNQWVSGSYENTIDISDTYKEYSYLIKTDIPRKVRIKFKTDSLINIKHIYKYIRLILNERHIYNNQLIFCLDESFFNNPTEENSLYLNNIKHLLYNLNGAAFYADLWMTGAITGYENSEWKIDINKLKLLNEIPSKLYINLSFPSGDLTGWDVPTETDFNDSNYCYPVSGLIISLIETINNVLENIPDIILFSNSISFTSDKYDDFIAYINSIADNVPNNIGIGCIKTNAFFDSLISNASDSLKEKYIDVEINRTIANKEYFDDILKENPGSPYQYLYRKYKYEDSGFNVIDYLIDGRVVEPNNLSRQIAKFVDYLANLPYNIKYMIELHSDEDGEELIINNKELGHAYWLFYLLGNYITNGTPMWLSIDKGIFDFQYVKGDVNKILLNRRDDSLTIDEEGVILEYTRDNSFQQKTSTDSLGSETLIYKIKPATIHRYSYSKPKFYGTATHKVEPPIEYNAKIIKIQNRFVDEISIYSFINEFDLSDKVYYKYYITDKYVVYKEEGEYYFLKGKSLYPAVGTEHSLQTLSGKQVPHLFEIDSNGHLIVYHNVFDEPILLTYNADINGRTVTDHTELVDSSSVINVSPTNNKIIINDGKVYYIKLIKKYPEIRVFPSEERFIGYTKTYKFSYNGNVYYGNGSYYTLSEYAQHVKDGIYKLTYPVREIVGVENGRVLSVDKRNGYVMLDAYYGKHVLITYVTDNIIMLNGLELNYKIPYYPSSSALNNSTPIKIYVDISGIYYVTDDSYNAINVFNSDFTYNTFTPISGVFVASIGAYRLFDSDYTIEDVSEPGGGIETNEFFEYYAQHVLHLDTSKISIMDVIRNYFPDVDNYVDISTYDTFYDIENHTITVTVTKEESQNIRDMLRGIEIRGTDFYTKTGAIEDIKGVFIGNYSSISGNLTESYINNIANEYGTRFIGIDFDSDIIENSIENIVQLAEIFKSNDYYLLIKLADNGEADLGVLIKVWNIISDALKENPYVIYDIYGNSTDTTWYTHFVPHVVSLIRENDKTSLILVPPKNGNDLSTFDFDYRSYSNVGISLHLNGNIDYHETIGKYIGKYPFIITYLNTDDTNIIDLLNKDNIGWFITTGSIDDYIKNIIKTDPVTDYIIDYLTDNIRKHKAYGIPAILRYHNKEVIIP